MTVQGSITEETRDLLKSLVDDMCGLAIDINSFNYEQLIKARETYINYLEELTEST